MHYISCFVPQAETWLCIGETSKYNSLKFSFETHEAKKNIKEFVKYKKEKLGSFRNTESTKWAGKVTKKTWTRPDDMIETQWVLFPLLGSLTARAANVVALEAARISVIEDMVYNYGDSGLSIREF